MKTKFQTAFIFLIGSIILLPGCASIVSKSSYMVPIRTTPPGVNIQILNKKGKEVYTGLSPATVSLKSGAGYFTKARYLIKLSSPGFADKTFPVTFKLNGWYFGNLIIGGVLGMLIIDPISGAMWKINDPLINETMIKTDQTSGAQMPTLNIVDINDVEDNLKSRLVRIR